MGKVLLLMMGLCFCTNVSGAHAESTLSAAVMSKVAAWKACVDLAAKRYSGSNEPSENVARVAILSCKADLKNLNQQMIDENVNQNFQIGFFESLQKSALDNTTVQIMEERIRK
jgi:hypothetical protein